MKKLLIVCKFIIINYLGIAQIPQFCDTILYLSYYNETNFNEKTTYQPEVTFNFNNDVIVTTMKDQMCRYRSYGIIEEGNDNIHIWKKYQCLDNSGSLVHITFAYEKPSKVQIIVIDYGSMYMYFEVRSYTIPNKIKDIFEHLSLDKDAYNTIYSNEDINKFLRQFGNPELITKYII